MYSSCKVWIAAVGLVIGASAFAYRKPLPEPLHSIQSVSVGLRALADTLNANILFGRHIIFRGR